VGTSTFFDGLLQQSLSRLQRAHVSESHVSLPAHFAVSGFKTLTAGKVFHGGATLKKHFNVVGPCPGQWLKGLDKKVQNKPKGWHGIWDFGPKTMTNRNSPITLWPHG
jgi:hypothetical protein